MVSQDNGDQFDEGLEDEFAADESYGEEDWESYDDQDSDLSADAPVPAPRKKRSPLFIVILIALAAAGGLGFTMMGGGNDPAPSASVPAPSEPVTASVEPVAPPPPSTPLADPVPAPMPAPVAETMPAPVPVAADPAAPMPGLPAPSPATDVGFLNSPEKMQALEKDIAVSFSNTELAELEDPNAPAPVEAAPSSTVSAQELLSAAEEAERAAAAVPVAPAEQDKIDDVLSRLDQLEGEIKTLKEQGATAPAAQLETLAEAVATLEKKIDSPAPASGATILAPAKAPSRPAPKAAPAPEWILKGAQPGRAMVARKGETDMRAVAVGDILPGIGEITGVVYENGRWLVRGTKGQISQ